jgi:hypothetical protein
MTPARSFDRFLARYSPEIRAAAKASLAKMRRLLPGAVEFVYDNYNALVIGFGPSERPSEALFSLACYPRWVTLFFLDGADLVDPAGLLKGDGKIVRHIRLETPDVLDDPAVRALMAQALKLAHVTFDGRVRRKMIIRSISPRQRPRKPRELRV